MKLLAQIGLLTLMVALLGAAFYLPQLLQPDPGSPPPEEIAEVIAPVRMPPPAQDGDTLEVIEVASRPAEIPVDAFYAALEAGHLSEARAFLEEKSPRLSPHLRDSLERSLTLAERQETERQAAKKLRQSVTELEAAARQAKLSAAEAARLKEELRRLKEEEAEKAAPPPPSKPAPAPRTLAFDFDSSRLQPAQEPIVSEAAAILRDRPDLSAEVRGFADRQGNPAYNATLSTARSVTVKDALVAAGVDPGRISVVPFGDTQSTEQATDRRVEIRFHRPAP